MKYRRIKGTQDILPDMVSQWQYVENMIRQCMDLFNYQEMRTPVFELTEVFARGIGQQTDIVSKEMYSFQDKGKKNITLKPEMTAPVMRAYLENNMSNMAALNKIYYISPLFRQENPQAGRLRQFHQFGAEAIGSNAPELDAELIMLAMYINDQLGISNLKLKVNSVGDPDSREIYILELKNYFKPLLKQYCHDCNSRYKSNPLRILDCKNKTCKELNKNVPKLVDFLNERSSKHFGMVKSLLEDNHIDYEIEPYLVRGLDYYTDTVFEITSENLGSQDAVCGGGRYDLLSEQFGGPPTPAIGFAAGIERLLLVMQAQDKLNNDENFLDVYICTMGEKASHISMTWLQKLRKLGLRVDRDFLKRSVKAQMRDAHRQNAKIVLLLGDNEIENKSFSVKDMDSGKQSEISLKDIEKYLRNHLKTQ
ncbi:MAG: histidine--tRNA ligase [Calditrichia bacterium]|jgi:histidyl-tRNA synthetase|nr:histidine--tRNA ligase [Calditrichia bacterium]